MVLLEVMVQMVKASLKHIRAQLRELKEKIEEKTLSMRQSRWQDVNLGKKQLNQHSKWHSAKLHFAIFIVHLLPESSLG